MKLIINADDYGCTVPVSLGIIEGMKYGLISSTSALVPCDCFQEMASYAIEHGLKKMGIHCMLTMLKPTLPREKVQSLVDENGYFFDRKGFMSREVDVDEARAELENQIRIFLESGLQLDHIDTHHGFMMKNDTFFHMFMDLAQKYQVPLRNELSRADEEKQRIYTKECFDRKIRMADCVYFNHSTPHHTIEDVKKFLINASEKYKVVEIGCHPGHSDAYLRSLSVLNDDREIELDVMTSPELLRFVEDQHIEIIGFEQL